MRYTPAELGAAETALRAAQQLLTKVDGEYQAAHNLPDGNLEQFQLRAFEIHKAGKRLEQARGAAAAAASRRVDAREGLIEQDRADARAAEIAAQAERLRKAKDFVLRRIPFGRTG